MDIIDRIAVLRSKNAGPFLVTFDIVFREAQDFQEIKKQLTKENIAAAFRVDPATVVSYDFFDELLATKISLKRRLPCGHPGDPDCFAMNQEEPLAGLLRQLIH